MWILIVNQLVLTLSLYNYSVHTIVQAPPLYDVRNSDMERHSLEILKREVGSVCSLDEGIVVCVCVCVCRRA